MSEPRELSFEERERDLNNRLARASLEASRQSARMALAHIRDLFADDAEEIGRAEALVAEYDSILEEGDRMLRDREAVRAQLQLDPPPDKIFVKCSNAAHGASKIPAQCLVTQTLEAREDDSEAEALAAEAEALAAGWTTDDAGGWWLCPPCSISAARSD